MSQGAAAENEDLKRRLEAAEGELRTVLEGSGGQEERGRETEGGAEPDSSRVSANGSSSGEAGAEPVQTTHRTGRKSRRSETSPLQFVYTNRKLLKY